MEGHGVRSLRPAQRRRPVRAGDLLDFSWCCCATRAASELGPLGSVEYELRPRRLVGHLAELTARELGLAEQQVARVRFAALVCGQCRDQIPAEIVRKQGPLTPAEWSEVQRHPELGAALIADVSLEDIREWILCHRERPDGRGYPRGLNGEQIPLEALILSVADAYTAIIAGDGSSQPQPASSGAGDRSGRPRPVVSVRTVVLEANAVSASRQHRRIRDPGLIAGVTNSPALAQLTRPARVFASDGASLLGPAEILPVSMIRVISTVTVPSPTIRLATNR